MKDGIRIPAGLVRLIVLVLVAAVGAFAYREYPEVRRYLKAERM